MIYGDDINSETNQNSYSTYIQLAYNTILEKNSIDFVLGFNPFSSYYGNQFGIVNAGFTIHGFLNTFKEIPIQASLITNPFASNIFLSFGFTL